MRPEPVKIGVVGCGQISALYLAFCVKRAELEFVACADLLPELSEKAARQFGIPRACGTEELLADAGIEIVLNLTDPASHAAVSRAALAAGKSVYSEKPLALEAGEGRALLSLAAEQGVRIAAAPDTFLGAAQQTARRLVDEGAIGRPVAATAFMMGHGPSSWHPEAGFEYRPGFDPLFDMGPYYLTALVHLLGPVRRVAGVARSSFGQRFVAAAGEAASEAPTYVTAALEFISGAVGTLITTFDACGHHLPPIEVHGSSGSLSVPDPNRFDGAVRLHRAGGGEWVEVPLDDGHAAQSRGLGVADLAAAWRTGREHRAAGRMAAHVLEVLCAILESSQTGRHVPIESTCDRPAPLQGGSL